MAGDVSTAGASLERQEHPRTRAARRRRAPASLVVPAVAVALLVNVPLVYIFVRAAGSGLDAYLESVWTPLVGTLLWRTLTLAVSAVGVSLMLAVPLAWLVVRTDLPGRRFWAVAGALPLVFPSYVAAFALVAFLGPRGYLQGWLEPLGVVHLGETAYGFSGALLALSLFSYPYIYLLLVAALRDLDPALEESSVSLGVGRFTTFFRVTLPQLRGPLYAGSLLVALYALSDFGAVSIVRYNTFTLSIYNAYRSLFDRTVAASLASVLVLLTLGFILLEAWLAHRVRPSRTRPSRPAPRLPLGRFKVPALVFVSAVTLAGVVMPLGVVGFWGVRALWVGNPLGTAGQAAVGSLTVSVLAAVAAVILAVPPAAWSVRGSGKLAKVTERLCHSGYALPGLVIALSLVFFVARWVRPLYQTLTLLVIAYVIRFLPQALGAARSSLAAVAPAFEEVARSLGRSTVSVLSTLTLPLVRPGLLAGGGLVFLTTMKELPATLLLRPTGFDTLATRVWTAAAEGIYSEAAVPALALVAVSVAPVYLLTIRPVLKERA